ncbi:hypothetical protein N9226_00620 [bacterium]|nr:hypothetical protein [bacterium]
MDPEKVDLSAHVGFRTAALLTGGYAGCAINALPTGTGAPHTPRLLMKAPSKLLGAALVLVASSEIGACVVVQKLRPAGALESAAPDAAAGGSGAPGLLEGAYRPNYLEAEGLHPYLGFLRRSERDWDPDEVMTLNQPELYLSGSPLLDGDPQDLMVAIAGGSVSQEFALGGGAEALGELLSSLPQFEGRNVRFVALGGGGVKQPQQLFALEWLLVQGAQLDLLINIDGFNEVALHELENEHNGVAPIYPRNWRLRTSRLDLAEIIGERAYVQRKRRELASGLLASPLRFSQVRQLIWIARDRNLRHSSRALDEALESFEANGVDDFVSQGPREPGSSEDTRRASMVALWRRSSLLLDQACKANGIEYYHFLQPNQYVVGSKPLSEEEARVAISTELSYGSFVPEAYPLLQSAGDELSGTGVRFHDLTLVYEDRPESIYVDDCCHVNRLGNQILAEAIAGAVASWGR